MKLSPQMPEILTHWEDAPSSPGSDLSFALDGEGEPRVSIWRLDLPSDSHIAMGHLDRADWQVEASQNALDDASSRIDQLVDRLASQESSQVSFSSLGAEHGGGKTLPPAERELLFWLDGIQPDQVTYGLGGASIAEFQAAREKFQAVTQDMLRLIAYHAWVETQLEGRLLARTVVGYSGDMETAWQEKTLPEEYALHHRSLKLALASRIILLRTFTVAAQGATKLSLLLATPGGALLALPAAWKFVENILEQVNEYQSIKGQP